MQKPLGIKMLPWVMALLAMKHVAIVVFDQAFATPLFLCYAIGMALLAGGCGVGLFQLKSWAWPMTVTYIALVVIVESIVTFFQFTQVSGVDTETLSFLIGQAIGGFVIHFGLFYVWPLVYLLRKDIRQIFQSAP